MVVDSDNEETQNAVLEALAELVYGKIAKFGGGSDSKGGILEDLAAGEASQYDLLAAAGGKKKAVGKTAKTSGYKVKGKKGK